MSIIFSKEKDGTLNVHASGYVTKDPRVNETVVLFSVCYGKGKYIDCKAWTRDVPGKIAACLERHDQVSVDGVFGSYTGKDGQTHDQVTIDGITPMIVPQAAPMPQNLSKQVKEMNAQAGGNAEANDGFDDLTDIDGELPF